MSKVWVSPEGKWLVISTRITSTGTHHRASFTTDIDKATVVSALPDRLDCEYAQRLIPIPAYEVRKVVIGYPDDRIAT
jgi:hypothetical protein